ncbi:hypothetical protein CSUI_007818 [Cystoisospora suis]|uniref:Uncharacterized protein n=1 Tax=Cystoisospora suis TaxID=483139 RepID=A0A2C6KPC2_9APIC|nr:hypothetical protein CSUI_007818 [Cystoisospora suis]
MVTSGRDTKEPARILESREVVARGVVCRVLQAGSESVTAGVKPKKHISGTWSGVQITCPGVVHFSRRLRLQE